MIVTSELTDYSEVIINCIEGESNMTMLQVFHKFNIKIKNNCKFKVINLFILIYKIAINYIKCLQNNKKQTKIKLRGLKCKKNK